MKRCIALLTDFGLCDPYLGQMKGVLEREAPDVKVLDLCHGVEPHNVLQGAFFLASSAPHFPGDTLFLAVVDPGVGGQRRIVLLDDGSKMYMAPDNGLLSHIAARNKEARVWDMGIGASKFRAGATFHGRDIFARLAAEIAMGAELADLGTEVPRATMIRMEWSRAEVSEGTVTSRVVHVDRFGNCVLNLPDTEFKPVFEAWPGLAVLVPGPTRAKFVRTYEDIPKNGLGVLAGSQGFLELAVNQGASSRILGLSPGDTVVFADPSTGKNK